MNARDNTESSALAIFDVERWTPQQTLVGHEEVAEELAVALVYNGISHVVMMATPSDLRDFAIGFSLSEGIVRERHQIYDVEIGERLTTAGRGSGIEVALSIAPDCFAGLKQRRRNLAGRTGCGLCGSESLKHAFRTIKPLESSMQLPSSHLHQALGRIREHQQLQLRTGATHAAFWLDSSGEIKLAREDIGRHNALDKLIGALADAAADAPGCFNQGAAIITSRASFEMVQKAAAVGIAILVAVSAPTALAVRMADELGLTLVGFARDNGHLIYTHRQRLKAQ